MPHSRYCRPRGWTAAVLFAALLAGCAQGDVRPARDASPDSAPGAVSVRDDAGRTVTLPRPATRILSLVPAVTEIVKILGGAPVLVGRTVWDTDPALAQLPSTENALSPSVEWLTSLRPELVIAWPDQSSRTVIERLEAIGIPVYASAVESLADIDGMIERIGTLLGQEARADSLRARVHAQLDSVRARVAGRPRPLVLYAVSFDPPMAATNATFLGELVEVAGGRNVFADLGTLWPQVSLEEIVRRQPEIIIRPVEDTETDVLATLRVRAGWRDVRAVREGRVYVVDVNRINRPGAGVGEAAALLAGAIHPEAYR